MPVAFAKAFVAMPDPVFGDKSCSYVILHPGKAFEFKELKQFLMNKKIAKFKLPERLEVVDEFPLTSVGKISKVELRKDIAEKLES